MRVFRLYRLAPLCALGLFLPVSARATDGHFLHGVGAVNSALGGVGVAAPASILGAFFVNPAGLVSFSGTNSELGFELFKPSRTVSSEVGGFGSGSTTSVSEFVPVPAFGWSRTFNGDQVAIGLGGLGIGGFGVSYAADPTNPVLAPRPNGFGQVYSNFSLLKVAPTVAWKATSKLHFGVALNIDWASLAVDPMPTAAPAFDPGPDQQPGTQDDRAFYSGAAHADGAFGFGLQAGFIYRPNERFAIGASYASPQSFEKFKFDAVYENPNLPNYNTARTFEFGMDVPAVYAAGIAVSPSKRLTAAVDVKYITYSSTEGFKESGFNADGSVKGFGWDDIAVVASGIEYVASDRLKLRGGYNYSGNPIPSEVSMFNVPAPAVVQHHLTGGLGISVAPGVELNLAAYHAFEGSVSGPMLRPNGAIPGSTVKSTLSENSFLIGFAFSPARK